MPAMLLAGVLLLGLAGGAAAQRPLPDPDAPPGATSEWLPSEPWVMQRWLPYSELRLEQVLDTDRYELGPWLSGGHRSLSDLARKKGISPRSALRAVMAPEHGRVSAAQFRVLSARAARTFSQRHLMQHMLTHNFHTWGANGAWRRGIGLSWAQIGQQRAAHFSLAQMAQRNGRSRASLFRAVRRAVISVSREGVRNGSTSRAQARDQLTRDLKAIPSYGDYRSGSATAASRPVTRRGLSAVCFLHR